MTALNAGIKRAYDQIQDSERNVRTAVSSTPQSRRDYRDVSRTSTPLDVDSRTNTPAGLVRNATFEPSASVVLVGTRGVGKSTLGVLAATAYNRRLVDSDKAFLEATGSTTAAYRKLHGSIEYQQRHNQVLENTLNNNSTYAIIICAFSDLEQNGATLIRKFARSHPVIHISRDVQDIQSYLQVWTIDRIKGLLLASNPLLRSCSNFEFFNLSENGQFPDNRTDRVSEPDSTRHESPSGGFLTLKRAERDFLRLLRNIVGDHNRGPSHQSAYPLSQVKIEDRLHTFSVSVSVSQINARKLDLDEIQIGADCVELIVAEDDFDDQKVLSDVAKAFAIVRRATILPILITPRSTNQAGSNVKKTSVELIKEVLRFGPDLCSIDLTLDISRLRQVTALKGNTRIIGALELSARPPSGWNSVQCVEACKRAAELDCRFAKITMPAQSFEDMFAIRYFQQTVSDLRIPIRLMAYSTGRDGRLSKCFNNVLTPVEPEIHPDGSDAEREREEGSVTAKAITEALFSSFVLPPLRFYIFGADVRHSLSPAMHNAAYSACGMRYDCVTYSSEELDDFKRLIHERPFGGCAVAHPFKMTVAAIMDGLSPHARAIGAVNTVVPIRELASDESIPNEAAIITRSREQGPVKALYGFNTDWIGIRACIRRGLSPANTIRPHTSALVCGAGGMARSAIYSLISLGVRNIVVCNRTLSNATALAEHYNTLVASGKLSELISIETSQIHIRVLDTFVSLWPSDIRQPTVIVNCIPRSDINDNVIDISLPDAWLKSPTGGVLVEVAYRLPLSPIIRQIRRLQHVGWIVMDGFDMIPEQAYSQFELFTGRRAPRKLMRAEILRHSNLDIE